MSDTVAQLSILYPNGQVCTYDEATFTAYAWGIHVIALDQEDLIPWHEIQLVSLAR